MEQSKQTACKQYEAEWEGYLDRAQAAPAEADVLAAHLESCAACRQAVENARLAGSLIRESLESTPEPSGAFATRVMANIRAEEERRQQFWRPLESLAARVALTAATLLLASGFYLSQFAPQSNRADRKAQSDGEASLVPGSQPTNKDEVLLTLAGNNHGR